MNVGALYRNVAVSNLNDCLVRLGVVGIIDRAKANVSGAVECDDIAVGQADL